MLAEDFFINRILSSCFICKLEVFIDECFNSNLSVVGSYFMAPLGKKHSLHSCCCFKVAAEIMDTRLWRSCQI